jgi:molecular chaperone DnaJ
MAKRDYYEVLGVSKTAAADEIKKTFRNRARQLHPDNKDSGDEAAFKELAEAYEVLSDQSKRAQYDRHGHQGVQGAGHGFDNVDFSSMAGFGIDDIIDMFFGGGGGRGGAGRSGPEPGSNLKYDLQIDFLEAVFGVEKKITIKRLEDCDTCKGSGAAEGSEVITCVTCAGMGQVQQVMQSFFGQTMRVIECPACQGTGKKIDKPCKDCKGEAQVRKAREFDLKVPAGIDNGARMRLTGAGDKGRRGGGFGDLYVIVHVREHKQFVRDGDTIHIRQPITFSMAGLGGELMVPTVDGDRLLKIPSGIQHGTTLVMRDSGVPRYNNPGRRGEQVVHVSVETPSKLGSEEKELLKQLAELRGESLTVTESEREADAELEASKKNKETQAKNEKKSKSKSKDKDEPVKEDSSIIDKIGEFFRPKNGDNED